VPDFSRALALTDAEWIDFLAGVAPGAVPGLPPPALPDESVQDRYVGSHGVTALREAGAFYSRIWSILDARGVSRDDMGRVLDFGCGWGRIYRFFLRHAPPAHLIGIDIDDHCIELCRSAMPYGTFLRSPVLPPLAFDPASLDVITAYSVFSHLSQASFERWLDEFRRLLAPGGFLFFTTLKIEHLDVWDRLAVSGNEHYRDALARAAFSRAAWETRIENGDFLFVPTGGGDMRDSSFYGEAILSPQYLVKLAPAFGFRIVEIAAGLDLPQSFVALHRESS
jgi:SAM-dependent methyltransferase